MSVSQNLSQLCVAMSTKTLDQAQIQSFIRSCMRPHVIIQQDNEPILLNTGVLASCLQIGVCIADQADADGVNFRLPSICIYGRSTSY